MADVAEGNGSRPVTAALGLVAGTVPATPLKYSVSLAPGQYAQLDDVVVTQRGLPGRGGIQIAGVVTNVEAVHEGARFASDVFLIEQGALPAEVCEVAEVTVTRVEPEMYVPPLPGAVVTRAAGAQRDSALYFDEMGASKVPVGFARDGQPVYVNFEFIDGTRGAHVSTSGVSGIATKTSFAMFLLQSIINCGVLAGEAHNTKALIFSVKSEDLLFLDYANSKLTPAQREQYAALGLPADPFGNVRVFAPPRPDDPAGTPDVSARDRAVSPFYWTLAEFCEQELLPFVFADSEDERAQYTMLIGQVAARLRRDVVPAGTDGAIKIRGVDPDRDKILRSFGDLVTLLETELGDDSTRASWVAGSAVTGSVNALLRRLRSAVRPLSVIVRGDLAYRGDRSISTSRAQVTVVDLHNLLDEVYRPVLGQLGLHVLGLPKRPGEGGTVALRTRGGEAVKVAALPFLSHRYAVRAAEVLLHDFAEHSQDHARQVAAMVSVLTKGFTGDAVNVVMAHATLLGGRRGGGERDVQTSLGYELPASMFPPSAHYVALGHLHRCQEIPGPCPIFCSGSPLAVDFGEQDNDPSVLVVTAAPGVRADARPVSVTGGRPLRTLRGTLDHVIAEGEQAGDAYLRVVLAEPGRAGLADLVRERLPNTLQVMLDDAHQPRPGGRSGDRTSRIGRSPRELFADFLTEENIDDPRLTAMFAELLDEVTSDPSGLTAMTGEA